MIFGAKRGAFVKYARFKIFYALFLIHSAYRLKTMHGVNGNKLSYSRNNFIQNKVIPKNMYKEKILNAGLQ
jgi:hypothetical protein